MIIWFLFFNLLMWHITLIDLLILKNLCIPEINPTWLWCIILSTQKLLHCKRYYKQYEKTTEGEKILANNVTDKELVSKMHKQLTQHIARGEEALGPELGGDGGLATGSQQQLRGWGGPSAPGWPAGSGENSDSWADQPQISSRLVSAVRLECPLLWGILQHWLQPPPDLFPSLGLQVDWHPIASKGEHTQGGPAVA